MIPRFFFPVFFLLSFSVSTEASSFSEFFKLSRYEKWWVLTHPFVAHKAFLITHETRMETDSMRKDISLDQDPYGGQVDAFRHAYWMARLAQNMKWKKAISLGVAHEKANYLSFKKNKKDEDGVLSDSLSSVMDLSNNKIGVALGCNFKSSSPAEIKTMIIHAILEGKMIVLKKNKTGDFLDCYGKVVLNSIEPNWFTPKCLVSSKIDR